MTLKSRERIVQYQNVQDETVRRLKRFLECKEVNDAEIQARIDNLPVPQKAEFRPGPPCYGYASRAELRFIKSM